MEKKKRFVDNGDGTVTDNESGLMWKQTDSYQDTSKWLNWYDSLEYLRNLNNKKFAGHTNWRFPTLDEAEGIYDEEFPLRDMDRLEIHLDSSFSPGGGFTTWTSKEGAHSTAAVFYYRYGHANLANKEGITKDSVRAVRDISGDTGKPVRHFDRLSSGRQTS